MISVQLPKLAVDDVEMFVREVVSDSIDVLFLFKMPQNLGNGGREVRGDWLAGRGGREGGREGREGGRGGREGEGEREARGEQGFDGREGREGGREGESAW